MSPTMDIPHQVRPIIGDTPLSGMASRASAVKFSIGNLEKLKRTEPSAHENRCWRVRKTLKPINIVLTEGYSDWEIAPLGGAGRAFYGADIRFTSPNGGTLTSAAGLVVSDTGRFEAPSEGVVVVCGSPAFESSGPPDLSAALVRAKKAGCIIAGICGGTIALARAGLLDSVNHTSNAPGYLEKHASAYAGARKYVDQPKALRDDNIITAPAPAPASFAAAVLTAAGLDRDSADELQNMLAAEHVL